MVDDSFFAVEIELAVNLDTNGKTDNKQFVVMEENQLTRPTPLGVDVIVLCEWLLFYSILISI